MPRRTRLSGKNKLPRAADLFRRSWAALAKMPKIVFVLLFLMIFVDIGKSQLSTSVEAGFLSETVLDLFKDVLCLPLSLAILITINRYQRGQKFDLKKTFVFDARLLHLFYLHLIFFSIGLVGLPGLGRYLLRSGYSRELATSNNIPWLKLYLLVVITPLNFYLEIRTLPIGNYIASSTATPIKTGLASMKRRVWAVFSAKFYFWMSFILFSSLAFPTARHFFTDERPLDWIVQLFFPIIKLPLVAASYFANAEISERLRPETRKRP
jgi:hypothetical protein